MIVTRPESQAQRVGAGGGGDKSFVSTGQRKVPVVTGHRRLCPGRALGVCAR